MMYYNIQCVIFFCIIANLEKEKQYLCYYYNFTYEMNDILAKIDENFHG